MLLHRHSSMAATRAIGQAEHRAPQAMRSVPRPSNCRASNKRSSNHHSRPRGDLTYIITRDDGVKDYGSLQPVGGVKKLG